MKETSVLDLIEDLFAQGYSSDEEIDTDELEELLRTIEWTLRERDEG